MLAVVTTDYPLEPGEAIDVPAARGDASFNAISVDGECSTNDAVILLANGASGVERTPATDARSRAALRKVCADLARQIVADGEGATVLARDRGPRRGDRRARRARSRGAIATSPLVKTARFGHDANWGRIAGRRRLGAVQRRLRAARPRPADARRSTASRARRRRADRRRAGRSTAPSAAIELDLGARRRRSARTSDRPVLRLRADQRGVHDVSRIVAQGRRRVAGARRPRGARAARAGHDGRRRARRRPADLGGDGAARARARVRRRPARDRPPTVSRSSARRSPPSTRALCAAIGPGAVALARRRDRARGASTCRSSGSSATRVLGAAGRARGARGRARSRSSRRSPPGR